VFLSFFFPLVISAVFDVYHTSTHDVALVRLECMSEMCCKRLAGNTERKNSPSGQHHSTLSGYIFATKACSDNRKKIVKQQYLLHVLTIWRTSAH